MAKIYPNNKNFLIIQMSRAEASSIGFGVKVPGNLNFLVCDTCNAEIEGDTIYYIAALNSVLCDDCLNDTIKNLNHYTDYDSIHYEINHFNIIAQKLSMPEKAGFSPDNKIVITT